MTGPIPDLSALSDLTILRLYGNQLTGPIPDLSGLTKLAILDLSGNLLCLPEGTDLSGLGEIVAAHLASLNLPSCASVASAAEERNALVAFYEATNGANWRRSDNWLSDQPVGTWYGVGAGDSGHVIHLILESNGLSGTLPDLSAFTYLQALVISMETN